MLQQTSDFGVVVPEVRALTLGQWRKIMVMKVVFEIAAWRHKMYKHNPKNLVSEVYSQIMKLHAALLTWLGHIFNFLQPHYLFSTLGGVYIKYRSMNSIGLVEVLNPNPTHKVRTKLMIKSWLWINSRLWTVLFKDTPWPRRSCRWLWLYFLFVRSPFYDGPSSSLKVSAHKV